MGENKNEVSKETPTITQKDIDSGEIYRVFKVEIPVKKEINDWLKTEKIDLNKLLTELIENFYQTVKNSGNKAAL